MNTLIANVIADQGKMADFVSSSWRPYGFKPVTVNGHTVKAPVDERGELLVNSRQLATNAFLNEEEWERLDEAITRRIEQRFQIVRDIRAAGLVSNTTLAEWLSKWRVASEVTYPDVTMDFETQPEEDRVDMKTYEQPIPIISKGFSIGMRELMTARAYGSDIETLNAEEAAQSVAEKMEYITINGYTDISLSETPIYGLRTLGARYTDVTADGDFGTLSNIYPTFRKVVAGIAGERYYGPFRVYMANDQYNEMMQVYSDGSGETALDRVLRMPAIQSIEVNDLMTAGEFVGVQMDSRVIDMRLAMDIETRQWENPDGSRLHFKVAMAGIVRLKTDYNGDSGIFHVTGA
jgi:uncharacterized linocin/CFP29 family protein